MAIARDDAAFLDLEVVEVVVVVRTGVEKGVVAAISPDDCNVCAVDSEALDHAVLEGARLGNRLEVVHVSLLTDNK